MKSPGNERLTINLTGLGIGDRDVIHLEGAPDGALVVGFGFDEVGQGAEFVALRNKQVAQVWKKHDNIPL